MRKTPVMESHTICDIAGHTLFVVRFTDTSGEVIQKTLSPEDYADLITGSLKEDRAYWRIRPDFIPEGFVDGCISDNSNYLIAFKVKGRQRPFDHKSGIYNIPFPDLVFFIRMGRGRILDKEVYALKEGSDVLYQYPFGNVSTSGSICSGNIDLDEVRKEGPAMFAELFFLGKTNNDYFGTGSHITTGWSQEELLRRLDGKKKFPERLLKESWGMKSLHDITNKIAKMSGRNR